MEEWLQWSRGPVFRFSFLLMILGLLRLVALNLLNLGNALRRAGNTSVPWRTVALDTARWLLPYRTARRHLYITVASILFHVGVIVTPIFLGAHIMLWERGIGVSWPALPQPLADYLTLTAIVAAIVLFVTRVSASVTRTLSRAQDYLLPLLLLVPFVSGYLAMHPASNPFGYNGTMFVHVMSGNIIMILMPFSKLSHAVLFPTTQLVSEMAWHLGSDSGRKVAVTLGKENEPI